MFGQEHIDRYLATDGAEGHEWRGTVCLLLTTVGSKTGLERVTPLIYGTHGEDLLVVASKGGAPDHPAWYRNLVAKPRVTVQVKADKFPALARTADDAERTELWSIMTREWPAYDEYQTTTDRKIPIVVLTRV